jgi:uracil DNA glycosylase
LSEYSEKRRELQSSTSPSTSGFIVWNWTNFVFFKHDPSTTSNIDMCLSFALERQIETKQKCKNITEQCHQSVTEQPSSCKCVFEWRRSGTFLCDLV